MNISKRIKAARKKLGLTQPLAAKQWKFALGTLQAWEQGIRNPAGLYRAKLEAILKEITQDFQNIDGD